MGTPLEDAFAALRKLQDFDVSSLPQKEKLGAALAFTGAVSPAERLVHLYRLIPLSILKEFPDQQLQTIVNVATQSLARLQSITDFDVGTAQNPTQTRDGLIANLSTEYVNAFNNLYPLIAYAGARTLDLGRLETEGRAVVESVRRETDSIIGDMRRTASDAERILADVRQVAEEQGVSQQAFYFRKAADDHDSAAAKWQRRTIWVGVGLAAYAVALIASFKLLSPSTPYEAAQLLLGKTLLFGVGAYLLVLASRTYMANAHNAVVNRHRQNALVTFQALADASQGDGHRDIVLAHAAACVFAPQETGFTRQAGAVPGTAQTLVEVLPKLVGGPSA